MIFFNEICFLSFSCENATTVSTLERAGNYQLERSFDGHEFHTPVAIVLFVKGLIEIAMISSVYRLRYSRGSG